VKLPQAINYNHLMPTRYVLELDSLKGAVSQDTLKEDSQKVDAKKNVKKVFEQKYAAGQNKWFFQSLRWAYTLPFRRREEDRADAFCQIRRF
jgi:large subunit ribosomal protein L27e